MMRLLFTVMALMFVAMHGNAQTVTVCNNNGVCRQVQSFPFIQSAPIQTFIEAAPIRTAFKWTMEKVDAALPLAKSVTCDNNGSQVMQYVAATPVPVQMAMVQPVFPRIYAARHATTLREKLHILIFGN